MKKLTQKILAMLLCMTLAISLCAPALALDGRTEQYARKAAAAGISKAMGQIPAVGEVVSEVIDTFLPDMLGVTDEHDEVMAKLDEIYDAVINLDVKMDKQQQVLFHEFYQQKINDFNNSANGIKGTVENLYTRLAEIEREYYGRNQDEKQVAIATLITSNSFDDPGSAMSLLKNLTDYVCGTQISNNREDGIFQLAYKAGCNDSVLGCEAAIKASDYVNSLSRYLENAYKTLFAIYAAKLYVCENHDRIAAEMADGTVEKCDLSGYSSYSRSSIKSAVFGSSRSSLLEYYNRLFDESRSDSAINVYNNMIADAWFSFIDSTDYTQKPARINYIPLSPEMGFTSPKDMRAGYQDKISYEYLASAFPNAKNSSLSDKFLVVANGADQLEEKMLSTAHSALSVEQTERLMKHLSNNPAFGTDRQDLSAVCILDDLGFSFSEYNAYVESLPKPSGMWYRDPALPRAQTDGKNKIFPMSTEHYYDEADAVPKGWFGFYVNGYALQENVNGDTYSVSSEMARICLLSYNGDKVRDCVFDNTLLLYFEKPDTSPIASFFASPSAVTIPIICVGLAAIAAVPIVILSRKKKKAAKQETEAE